MQKLKVIGTVLAIVCAHNVQASTWTTLDAPGVATMTSANGISGNYVTGSYQDVSSLFHGFLYDGTNWTTLDMPGARQTFAFGISGNNIVGWADNNHGFEFDGTNWTALDAPWSTSWTTAFGISGNNIVGIYDYYGQYRGFLYDGTNWTTLDAPGSIGTDPYTILGNTIIGWYENSNGFHGFLYDGTNWTTLDAPGASRTEACGISGNNVIGWYNDAVGSSHVFLYDRTNWITLDAPGASQTEAWATDGNTIAGVYEDFFGRSHGFICNIDTLAPEITEQPPASQSVSVGSTVILTVVAINPPLNYQWYFGTNVLSGETNATLTLTKIAPPQSGTYSVSITNPFGTVTSDPAIVNVVPGRSWHRH